MEATLLDIPAIALSQHYLDGEAIPWQTAARLRAEVIRRLTQLPWPEHTLMNINFPAATVEGVSGHRGYQPGQAGDRGQPDGALRPPRPTLLLDRPGARGRHRRARDRLGGDQRERVSVTPIYLNLTNIPVLASLKRSSFDVRPIGALEPGLIQKKLRLLMELRRAGIGDTRVLGAIERTRARNSSLSRSRTGLRERGLADRQRPDRQPTLRRGPDDREARAWRASDRPRDRHRLGVSDCGLASLCRRVFSIERHRELLRDAERRFEEAALA